MKKYQVSFINHPCETRCIEVEASGTAEALTRARNELIDFRDNDKWRLNFCVAASYDQALEKADIIRQIVAIRDNIEEVANQVFEATHWPIARVRNANEHLMDAKKSLSAAVAAFPVCEEQEPWTRGPEPMLDKP